LVHFSLILKSNPILI